MLLFAYFATSVALISERLNDLLPAPYIKAWYCTAKVAGVSAIVLCYWQQCNIWCSVSCALGRWWEGESLVVGGLALFVLIRFAFYRFTLFLLLTLWFCKYLFVGQLLNFNIALVLMLMLKHTYSALHKYSLMRKLIPFDDMAYLHKSAAYITLFLGLVHTIAHSMSIGESL